MVAEAGNFYVVLPFMFTAVAALLVIWFAMRGDRKGPTIPNLTARRKHPLRHLQVELNRARKEVRDKAAEEGQEGGDQAREAQAQGAGDRPKKRRRGDDGPRLRRLK
jgi:Cytochrome c biogenesis factor